MKMKYLIAASVVALTAASGAKAADVVMVQEPAPVYVAPMFSWTGFYAGGQIGGTWADTDQKIRGRDLQPTPFTGFGKNFSPDPSGFMGGLYAGYNFDMGNNIVIGAETDWVWADMDDSSSETYNAGAADEFTVRGKIKEKWAGATRARIGYAADRWLPYFAAGVAYAKVDSNVRFSNPTAGTYSSASGDKTMTGWTVGAGFDYAMTDNVILRAEYRYTDFGDKDFGNDNFKYNVDYRTNDVRVGVAYKF
ncbi:outer membrane protein [Bartonella tamiae]|uniref:Outer membrane autotransporter barrel domain-containing protein n=1 Tax=Bartonella tamiae Th239 TaxID=1094558 RepID=J1JYU1_9HYPH|nr:outer membrane protein [Bartonella tamiae]EJF90267.1 outer membrane autotransporter barrel domain-containing protein [Bartonella tamiae Th239]EJF93792.1 outer membrane autotransporter barrel domain-containing protein [Bartonella tamiae Th307]